jgi:hypothetical protein
MAAESASPVMAGTPLWMPPSRRRGQVRESNWSPRADDRSRRRRDRHRSVSRGLRRKVGPAHPCAPSAISAARERPWSLRSGLNTRRQRGANGGPRRSRARHNACRRPTSMVADSSNLGEVDHEALIKVQPQSLGHQPERAVPAVPYRRRRDQQEYSCRHLPSPTPLSAHLDH